MNDDHKIIRIQDADYGCEERDDDYVPMALLTLQDYEGREWQREVAYKWLDELDLHEGDWMCFDKGIPFRVER